MLLNMEKAEHMKFMAAALSSIGDGVIVTDRRGNIRYLNEPAEVLTGWSGAEAVGTPFRDVFALVDFSTGSRLGNPVVPALEYGVSVGLQNHAALITRQGNTRFVSANCSPVKAGSAGVEGAIVVFRDIDRMKNIEEEIRREKNNLKSVLEALPIGVLLMDDDTIVRWVNRPLLNLFRCEESSIVGQRFGDGSHCIYSYEKGCGEGDRCQFCEIRQSIGTVVREGVYRRDVVLQRAFLNGADENCFWFKTSFIPFATSEDKLAVVAIEDITEQKNLETSLQLGRDEAESANRVKSEFLANMSHEVRTPLNGIIGMLDLLLMSGVTDEQQEYVEMAKMGANSLLKVINDILDLSRLEAGRISIASVHFDIVALMEEIKKIHAALARNKGLLMKLSVDPDIPRYLTGDPDRLRQILNNLIGNAIKFTDRGQIKVAVRRASGTTDENIMLEFLVSDTGIGISDEKMDLLFKRFSQVDSSNTRKYSGTGLGLAICKQLVEMMGGSIRAESVPGHGSAFRFTVAVTPGQEPLPDAAYGLILEPEQPTPTAPVQESAPGRPAPADPEKYSRVRLDEDGELVYDGEAEPPASHDISSELEELGQLLQGLQGMIEEGKLATIEQNAHRVKKLSIRINADKLTDLAFKTELAARKCNWGHAAECGLKLVDEFKDMQSMLSGRGRR